MTKNFTKECVLNGNTRHLKEVMKTKKCHMSKKYSRMYIENYIKKTKKPCIKVCKTAVQIDPFLPCSTLGDWEKHELAS